MIGEVRTNGGLLLRNYTRYDTEDILAVVNEVEESVFPNGRVEFSPWAPNGVMAFVHAVNDMPTDARISRGRWETRAFKARAAPYRSPRCGTISVVHPNRVHDNPLESLATAGEAEQRAPELLASDIANVVLVAYNMRGKAMRHFTADGSWPCIRIHDKPALTRPKDGKGEERRRRSRRLNKATYTLETAAGLIGTCLQELGMAGAVEYDSSLLRIRAQLMDLRDEIKVATNRNVPVTLTPSKENT